MWFSTGSWITGLADCFQSGTALTPRSRMGAAARFGRIDVLVNGKRRPLGC
jgi:hypothetical protein